MNHGRPLPVIHLSIILFGGILPTGGGILLVSRGIKQAVKYLILSTYIMSPSFLVSSIASKACSIDSSVSFNFLEKLKLSMSPARALEALMF